MGKGNGTSRSSSSSSPRGLTASQQNIVNVNNAIFRENTVVNTRTESIPTDDKSDRWLGEYSERITSEIKDAISGNPAFKNARVSVTNAFGLFPAVQIRGLASRGPESIAQSSELTKIQNSLAQKYGLGTQGITRREYGYTYGNDLYVYINRLNSASERASRESARNERWENLKRYLLSKR